jgi:hypothetical protein
MTGRLPAHQVDHKNRNRADDRWDNLREATPAQNCANTSLSKFNTSGFRGVYFHKPTEKWLASARVRCERRYLGLFKTAEEAGAVAAAARRDAFGEFAAL